MQNLSETQLTMFCCELGEGFSPRWHVREFSFIGGMQVYSGLSWCVFCFNLPFSGLNLRSNSHLAAIKKMEQGELPNLARETGEETECVSSL